MKEQEKDNNAKLIFTLVLSIIILIAVVVAGTYSFYTATINKNNEENNKTIIEAANISFGITDGNLIGENLIPGDTVVKEFQVSNTGNQDTTFSLMWKSVTNTFVNKNDLIITLEEEGTPIIEESDNVIFPETTTTAKIFKSGLHLNIGETKNYKLTITYKNSENLQNEDMGKKISAIIDFGE